MQCLRSRFEIALHFQCWIEVEKVVKIEVGISCSMCQLSTEETRREWTRTSQVTNVWPRAQSIKSCAHCSGANAHHATTASSYSLSFHYWQEFCLSLFCFLYVLQIWRSSDFPCTRFSISMRQSTKQTNVKYRFWMSLLNVAFSCCFSCSMRCHRHVAVSCDDHMLLSDSSCSAYETLASVSGTRFLFNMRSICIGSNPSSDEVSENASSEMMTSSKLEIAIPPTRCNTMNCQQQHSGITIRLVYVRVLT